jgi:hypothetical protein
MIVILRMAIHDEAQEEVTDPPFRFVTLEGSHLDYDIFHELSKMLHLAQILSPRQVNFVNVPVSDEPAQRISGRGRSIHMMYDHKVARIRPLRRDHADPFSSVEDVGGGIFLSRRSSSTSWQCGRLVLRGTKEVSVSLLSLLATGRSWRSDPCVAGGSEVEWLWISCLLSINPLATLLFRIIPHFTHWLCTHVIGR